MKKTFTLLLLVFLFTSIFAQFVNFNKGKIIQKSYLQEIPYQAVEGLPVVQVTINGKMYNFIFDTGGGLMISDKLYKELNLPIKGKGKVGDSSGEKKKMRFIKLPKMLLQEITFVNTPGIVFPEESEFVKWCECYGIEGLMGSNMVRKSVVQFDEKNKNFIIADNIKKLSVKTEVYQKLTLSKTLSHPFISVTTQKGEQRAVKKVLFDSGASSFYNISARWLKYYVADKIAEGEGTFSMGAHGVEKKQKHFLLNIPELIINDVSFSDITAMTTHSNYSRIGAKLFQYGKITLDYKKKHFYFEPFDNINTDELSKMPRAVSFSYQNNKLVVGIIWDKELESQINVGDEILSINGIDIQSMNFCEFLFFLIPDSDKQILEFRDTKTGEIKKIENKRMLLIE